MNSELNEKFKGVVYFSLNLFWILVISLGFFNIILFICNFFGRKFIESWFIYSYLL